MICATYLRFQQYSILAVAAEEKKGSVDVDIHSSLLKETRYTMIKNLLLVICVLAVLNSAWTLTFRVEPKSEECFYADVKPSTNLELTWAVIDGGLLDIRVVVSNNNVIDYN